MVTIIVCPHCIRPATQHLVIFKLPLLSFSSLSHFHIQRRFPGNSVFITTVCCVVQSVAVAMFPKHNNIQWQFKIVFIVSSGGVAVPN